MHRILLAGLVFALTVTNASAGPIAPVHAIDLNGREHVLPAEWAAGGVLILGFSHDARAAMDQWVAALNLRDTQANWLETPVIGDVPGMVRPMIRSGMRGRYATEARRAHIAPVFANADQFNRLAGAHGHDVVVLALNGSGEVVARAEGASTPANLAVIRDAMRQQTVAR